MNDPDETLSAIDAAIDGWVGRDFTVSKDAMRVSPGPPPDLPVRATVDRVTCHTIDEWADLCRRIIDAWMGLRPTVKAIGIRLSANVRSAHVSLAPLIYGEDYRRHRRTCRACNPAGNPKPLKVNGREYARRRKNRRSRGR
ncbi:hypothetical protein AB0K34_13725 [Actinomadura sp. NPDC049382]|uniref:hypothetical protein n=1 Tax=Actinomadura sp. NPDC049382 TaxID=3158220 RepID=UPI00342A05FB